MRAIDGHELKMFGQKWAECWFSISSNRHGLICGKNVQLLTTPSVTKVVFLAVVYTEEDSYYTPILLGFGGEIPEFYLPEMEDIIRFNEEWSRGDIRADAMSLSLKTLSAVSMRNLEEKFKFKFTLRLNLDYDFPRTGLISLYTGIYNGCTIFISRKVGDQNYRGLVPRHNLRVSFLDTAEIAEELNVTAIATPNMEEIALAIYHSLQQHGDITLRAAIQSITRDNRLSAVITGNLAVKLSTECSSLLLYHNQVPIGTVSLLGEVSFLPKYKDIQDDILEQLNAG